MARFYFKIQVMMQHPQCEPRLSPRGHWLPPKIDGANICYREPMYFHYQAHRLQLPPTIFLPGGFPPDVELEELSTYSIYYARNKFWIINYDATDGSVGDGLHDPNASIEEEPEGAPDDDRVYNWTQPSFAERGHNKMATVGMWLVSPRLPISRPDQRWAREILPDRYHAQRTTRDRKYGGLIGEIPLLIGLAAMSVHPTRVHELLPQIMVNPGQGGGWEAISTTHNPHGTGWLDYRGIVVTVYLDPRGEDADELQRFANGRYGAIFA